MSYGIIQGSSSVIAIPVTPQDGIATVLQIASSRFTSGLVVGANSFQISDLGNYTLYVTISVRANMSGAPYQLQLYNATLDQIVQSYSSNSGQSGAQTDTVTFPFDFAVTNAAHEYQIRIRTLTPQLPSDALFLTPPSFKATLLAVSGGAVASDTFANETLAAGTRVLAQADGQVVRKRFDNFASGGLVNIEWPNTLVAPFSIRMVLTEANEMRLTSTGGAPLPIQLEAIGVSGSGYLRSPLIVGAAIDATLIGTGANRIIFVNQLGGAWYEP